MPPRTVDDPGRAERAHQVAGMRGTVAADMVDDLARGRGVLLLDPPASAPRARMQERERGLRQRAVDMHAVLGQGKLRKAPVEIADAIAGDAKAKHQVLSARRRTDRIDLHEA